MTKSTDKSVKARSASSTSKLGLMALEPRILLDAAAVATGAEVAMEALYQANVQEAVEALGLFENTLQTDEHNRLTTVHPGLNITDDEIRSITSYTGFDPKAGAADFVRAEYDPEYIAQLKDKYQDVPIYGSDYTETDRPVEISIDPSVTSIVFVDSTVEGYEDLIAGIPNDVEVIIIGEGQDGLAIMAETLAGRQGIDAVHILSHGDAGQIQLGTTTLTRESITGEHADELAQIGAALSNTADILIYGCDFGADIEAVNALAEATGADIAASDDDTGAARLGGDWDLEVKSGDIETQAFAITAFEGLLDTSVINSTGGQAADGSDGLVIHVAANGQLQVEFRGATQFFHPDTTDDDDALFNGVYLAVGTDVIVPGTDSGLNTPIPFQEANQAAGDIGDNLFVEAGQIVSGSGTAVDPTIVTTTLFYDAAGDGGAYDPAVDFEVVIETIYVTPNPYFTQRVTITPPTGNTDPVKFYHTLDTFLNINVPPGSNPDAGPAFTLDQASGNPSVVGVARDADSDGTIDAFVAFAEDQGGAEFDQFYSAVFNGDNLYANGIAGGGDIINTIDTNPNTDNGLGIQFNLDDPGQAQTFTYHIAFRGEATIDLDADDSSGVTGNGYQTFYEPGAGTTIAIADSDAAIQNVVGDIQELRVALLNPETGDMLTVDAVNLPATIRVQSQSATEIVLEVVDFAQPESEFNLAIAELGFTTTSTVTGERSIEFSVTNEIGEAGQASAGTIIVNTAPVAADDGPISVVAGTTAIIPVLTDTANASADIDADGDSLTITAIIDPANPGTEIAISAASPVTLDSGTVVALLPDGSLNVTTLLTLAATETFTYVVDDGNGGTDQAVVNLVRDSGLPNVAPVLDLDLTPAGVPGQDGFTILTFSNPTIVNDGQNEAVHGVGNGETARYSNVGTVLGQSIDLVGTVLTATTNATGAPFDNPNFNVQSGDNANIGLGGNNNNSPAGNDGNAIVDIRWQVVLSGTDTPITGNFAVLINDLDQNAGNINRFEEISLNVTQLDSYVLEGDTDIEVTQSGDTLTFNPSDADPGTPGVRPDNTVQLNFSGTSEFVITYNRQNTGGNFGLDGNFTAGFFTNPVLVDVNADFAITTFENAGAVRITDSDLTVMDDGLITSATITLTNPQSGDWLIPPSASAEPVQSGNIATESGNDGFTVTTFTIEGDATLHTAGASVTIPEIGALIVNADGSYTFTPLPTYTGQVPDITVNLENSVTDPGEDPLDPSDDTIITLTRTAILELDSLVAVFPAGISLDPASTATNIILTGVATPEAYAVALNIIQFNSVSEDPDQTNRLVDISVIDDGGLSSNIGQTTIIVIPLNDAPEPVINPAMSNGTVVALGDGSEIVPSVVTIPGDRENPGTILVSDLLAQLNISDIEDSDFGIGVVSANEANGVWQYRRTDIPDHEWTDFQLGDPDNTDPTPVPDGEALLFDPDTEIRFIANEGFSGTANIQFRVWDMTFGTASNPPSTILDDSADQTNTSSLSSTVFVAGTATDYDGDGVNDTDDLDDDNDGILDIDEHSLFSAANGDFLDGVITEVVDEQQYSQDFGDVTLTYTNLGSARIRPFTESTSFSNEFYADGTEIEYIFPDNGAIQSMTFSEPVFTEFAITDIDQSGELHRLTVYDANGNIILNPEQFIVTTAEGTSGTFPGTPTTFTDIGTNVQVTPGIGFVEVSPINTGASPTFERANMLFFDFSETLISRIDVEVVGSNGRPGFLFSRVITVNDTDGDGVSDYLDLDSDNDGISDLIESGQDQTVVDANGDGVHDGSVDANGVPIAASGGVTPVDNEATPDGVPDYLDLDSDDDGIPDQVEAQPTAGYQTLTHVNNASNFGVNDVGLFVPSNSDGDANFDFRDTDSDNDGLLDSAESGLTPGADTNGDGIGDAIGASYADGDGSINNPQTDLANQSGDTSQVGYREGNSTPDVDLNDNGTTADTGFSATFTEAGGAVNVADTDATVLDFGDNDIVSLEIVAAGIADGVSEIVTIGGQTFPLNADASATVMVGGSTLAINFVTATGTFTITDSASPTNSISATDLTILVRGITYENTSVMPTEANRTLTFTAEDSLGSSGLSGVSTIMVMASNNAPDAMDDGPVDVTEDTPMSGNVLTNDTDADGDTLSVGGFMVVGDATNYNPGDTATITGVGTITIASDGSYTFTPDPDYTGPVPDTTVTVEDGNGGSDTSTLSFNDVININDAPVAVDDNVSTDENTVLSGNVLSDNGNGADSDTEGDTLTISAVNGVAGNVGAQITLASGALLTVNADGTYDYDSNGAFDSLEAGQSATDSFTYEVSDGNGGTDTATVTVTIDGVSDDDADGDGAFDPVDLDDDNDGILDADEGFVATNATSETLNFDELVAGSFADGIYDAGQPGEYTWTSTGDAPSGRLDRFDPATQGSDDGIRIDGQGTFVIDFANPVNELSFVLPEFEEGDFPSEYERATVNVYDINGNLLNAELYVSQQGSNVIQFAPNSWTSIDPAPSASDQDLFGQISFNFGSILIDRIEISFDTNAASIRMVEPTFTAFSGGVLRDTDSDGVADHLDLDSDNDGISDLIESGQDHTVVDTSNDGQHDGAVNAQGVAIAANGGAGVTVVNSDTDGLADFVDLDSDGDGIPDQIEAQPTVGYQTLTHVNNAMNDGVSDQGLFVPVNTDGDAEFDFRDTNSDGDMALDSAESGLTPGVDNNGDGIGDGIGATYGDGDGTISNPIGTLQDNDSATQEVAFRENTAPTAQDDDVTTDEATVLSGNVLSDNGNGADNDLDPEDTLMVTQVNGVAGDVGTQITLASGALLTVNTDGTYSYDPNGQFENLGVGQTGSDSFTYEISDSDGNIDTATVNITINGVNDAPVAMDDGPVAVVQDTPASGNVLTNDTDTDGDTLSVGGFIVDGDATNYNPGDTATITGVGALVIAGDGSFTFTPAAGYVGPIPSATVTVEDGNGGSDTSTLSFADVTNVNDAPMAADDGPVDVTEDMPVSGNVLPNDSDVDGDTLSVGGFMVAGDATNYTAGDMATITDVGTITVASDGTYTFTPDPDYTGPVPDVTVTVEDGNGGSDTSTLSFNDVMNVNDAPDAMDDGPVALTEDMPATGNILTNDTDADGDTLSVSGFTVDGDPTSYNPGDTATIVGVGTITLAGDGAYTFTPEPDYVGPVPDVIATVEDGNGGSDTSTLSFMDVANVNDAPVAQDDMETTGENTVASESVLPDNGNGADSDIEGDMLNVTQINGTAIVSGDPITLPSGAILTMNSDGTYLYNPNGQYENLQVGDQATDSFTYTIDDGNGGMDTATVTFTITGVNDQPDAADNDESFDADIVSMGNVITDNDTAHGQDSDVDGDTLVIFQVNGAALMDGSPVTLPSGAILTVNADGSYNYDPNGQYQSLAVGETATDGFSYTVDDGFGGSDTANVVITVNGVNDAPEPLDPSDPSGPADDQNYIPVQSADDSTAVTPLDLTVFFTDPDTSDTLALTLDPADLPSGLTFDGTEISGTLAADASQGGTDGTYIIPVTADDGNGGTFTTNVTYTITNPAPVIDTPIGAQAALDADMVSYATVATDPDGDTLTYSATGLPAGLSINTTTGEISGTIDNAASQGGPNSDGVYNVTVTVDDGEGGVVTDMFDLTVTNPAPVAQDDASSADEDGSDISGSVLTDNGSGADMDPDGDMIAVSEVNSDAISVGQAVTGTNGGLFIVNADGSYSFDPNGDFESLDVGETLETSIAYQLSDRQGGFDTATVTVTVSGANDAPVHVDPSDPAGPTDTQDYIPAQSGEDSVPLTDLDLTPFFTDVDDEPLTYGLDNPPAWLSIDPVTGVLSGTPPSDASQLGPNNDGVYAVTVTVTDPDGEIISTVIEYMITNPPPIAQDDAVSAPEDGPAISDSVFDDNGSGADIDPDGDPITIVSVNGDAENVDASIAGPTGGIFIVNADGSYSFDPAGNFDYLDEGEILTTSVTYEISDGQGGSDEAILSVMIIGANDAPVVLDPNLIIPAQTATDGMTVTPLDLSGVFGDEDETPLIFSASSLPPGLMIDPATGVISGTLTSGASQGGDNGVYMALITATDTEGVSVSTAVQYTVTNVAPVSQNDSFTIAEDTSLSANILANDTDADGDVLVIDAVALADGTVIAVGDTVVVPEGTLSVSASGDVSFVPAPDYFGTFVFGYTVTDNNGDTDMGSVSISVENVNDAPALSAVPLDIPVLFEGDTIDPISVGDIFTDADGDPLTFTAEGLPPGLSIDPDTGVITGTLPNDVADNSPYDVIITARDPSGATLSTPLVITLENPAPVVDTPDRIGSGVDGTDGELIALDGGTHDAGIATEIDVAAFIEDPDDDALSYRVESLPDGLSLDPETGIIRGIPLAPTEGPFVALVTVTDAQGGTLQFTLNLVIEGEAFMRPNFETSVHVSEVVRDVSEADPYTWVETQPVDIKLWFAEHSLAVKGLEGIDLATLGTDVEFRRGMAVSRANCYSDACNYLIIETIAYEHHVNIQLGSTIALENDVNVRSWEVVQGDGAALPDWAEHDTGNDMIFIQRPLDQSTLELQIKAIMDDGRVIIVDAEVDLLTGDLKVSEEALSRAQTLSEQLKLAEQNLRGQDADLIRALAS